MNLANGKQVKVYLYKYTPNSALAKFFTAAPTGAVGDADTQSGLDPADLDISSDKVAQYFADNPDFARLPYDSWLCRMLPVKWDATSGLTFDAAAYKNLATFYDKISGFARTLLPMHWLNNLDNTYLAKMREFMDSRRTLLFSLFKDAIATDSSSIANFVTRYDLSASLVSRTHDTAVSDFVNEVTLVFNADAASSPTNSVDGSFPVSSSAHFDTLATDGELSPVIAENDIIEVRVRYYNPIFNVANTEGGVVDSEGFTRVFKGYVAAASRTKRYNGADTVTVVCSGMSKIFSTFSTTWSAALRENNPDYFAIQLELDSPSPKSTILEQKFSGYKLDQMMDEFANNVLLSYRNDKLTSAMAVETSTVQASDVAPDTKLDVKYYTPDPARFVTDTGAASTITSDYITKAQPVDTMLKSTVATSLGLQASSQYSAADLLSNSAAITTKGGESYKACFSFQMMRHVSILYYLSSKWDEKDGISGDKLKFSRIQAAVERGEFPAFNLMFSNGVKLFYSDMKKPIDILGMIRQSMYVEIFEDRPGVLRLRPAKYNILNLNPEITDIPLADKLPNYELKQYADTGEFIKEHALNAEYIIPPEDITRITFTRTDARMHTRTDSALVEPVLGQVISGFTSHYTDPLLLLKYGLRLEGMVINPLCRTQELAQMFSALALASNNAEVRTIELEVKDSQEYHIGRLYYIPMVTDSTVIRATTSQYSSAFSNDKTLSVSVTKQSTTPADQIISKGFVGYVQRVRTTESYGNAPMHTVVLTYARKAEVIAMTKKGKTFYYTNFKHLPDFDGFMQQVTYLKERKESLSKLNPDNTTTTNRPKNEFSNDVSATYRFIRSTDGKELERYVINNNFAGTIYPADEANLFNTSIYKTSYGTIAKSLLAQLIVMDFDPSLVMWGPTTRDVPQVMTLTNRYCTDLIEVIHAYAVTAVCKRNSITTHPMVDDEFSNQSIKRVISDAHVNASGTLRVYRTDTIGDFTVYTIGFNSDYTPAGYNNISGDVVLSFVVSPKAKTTDVLMFMLPDAKSSRLCEILYSGEDSMKDYGAKAKSIVTATTAGVSTLTLGEIMQNMYELRINSDANTIKAIMTEVSLRLKNLLTCPYNYNNNFQNSYPLHADQWSTAWGDNLIYSILVDASDFAGITGTLNLTSSSAIGYLRKGSDPELHSYTASSYLAYWPALVGKSASNRRVYLPIYKTYFTSALPRLAALTTHNNNNRKYKLYNADIPAAGMAVSNTWVSAATKDAPHAYKVAPDLKAVSFTNTTNADCNADMIQIHRAAIDMVDLEAMYPISASKDAVVPLLSYAIRDSKYGITKITIADPFNYIYGEKGAVNVNCMLSAIWHTLYGYKAEDAFQGFALGLLNLTSAGS